MKRSAYLLFTILFVFSINLLVLSACTKKETVRESGEGNMPTQQAVQARPESKPLQEGKVPPAEEMKKAPEMKQRETVPGKKEVMAEEKTQLDNIHFEFNKYNLRPQDRKILSGHADWLLKNAKYNVKIEGNCDERGTEEYNMALGQRRADEAKNYFINMGIDKKRISTISYGKERPFDPGHNEEAWAKNRNDHFILIK
jgi:peptidoglycan-associated lipoprotein